MELKELCEKTLQIFKVKSVSELSGKLLETVINCDTEKYQQFCNLVEDLSVDWLQKIFQYYEADRKEKKQDYTPKSICTLCAQITETGGEIVYDICAGSGALTIQKWIDNPEKLFICEELDTKVISFLLFNMAVRNMNGYVINRDVLTLESIKTYRITKGDKFSTVEVISHIPTIKADEIISNPPYNIKWDAPMPMLADERFQNKPIPPSSNANYAFVITALSRLKDNGKCAFVLPCGALQFQPELEIRKYLVDNGYIEEVIALPRSMFESTDIPTCIIVFSCGNQEIKMFDARQKYKEEGRKQNGQFGDASHTNRTYTKIVNVLTPETIEILCGECDNIPEFSKTVTISDIQQNNYNLSPAQYIEFEYKEPKHRDYQEIADNYNYIVRMQNSCKLVINKTLAKQFGFDLDLYKQDKANSEDIVYQMGNLGIKLEKCDYIQFTKNKNEFVFKANDKEILPEMLIQLLNVWKNQIALLNTMQNQYLTELRDALLPDLMSGKLELKV